LQKVLQGLKSPARILGTLWTFGKEQLAARLQVPNVPVRHQSLLPEARNLGRRVRDFGLAVQSLLRTYREAILQRQYKQERIAVAACDLYASACTLSRLDHLLDSANGQPAESNPELIAGRYFLRLADRRIRHNLDALWDNDDAFTTQTADAVLGKK
jgi:hypothetical protein